MILFEDCGCQYKSSKVIKNLVTPFVIFNNNGVLELLFYADIPK
jgi:hypothetical protein